MLLSKVGFCVAVHDCQSTNRLRTRIYRILYYFFYYLFFFCEQVNANIQQSLDTEIESKDDQGIRESDSYFSVEEDEEVKLKDVSVL